MKREQIVDTLRSIKGHDTAQAFRDWVELTAIEFAQVPGHRFEQLRDDAWRAREERYKAVVAVYGPDVARGQFTTMFRQLIDAVEPYESNDPLGTIYESDLGLSNPKTGEFYTPTAVCDLSAAATLHGAPGLLRRGFIGISDPACGAGRMLVSAAMELLRQGLNPQEQAWFFGQDISPMACHMTMINLSIRGLPGVIVHGDTIHMTEHQRWYTPAFVLGGWPQKLQFGRFLDAVQAMLELPSNGDVELSRLDALEAQAANHSQRIDSIVLALRALQEQLAPV